MQRAESSARCVNRFGSMLRRAFAITLCVFVGSSAAAGAQATPQPSAASAVFARAKQVVVGGNGPAGRLLVDSVIAATAPDAPEYAEALYWRAALASNAADAERDYRRIVVDYALSPRSGDALLQLAQLELARADRSSATTHLQRFLLENPNHPERGRAGYLLGGALFEQNDPVKACMALGRTSRDVPADAVELRNQFDYLSSRCAGVDTIAGSSSNPPRSAADSATTPARSTHPRPNPDSSRHGAAPGRYSVQLAAYPTRAAADRLIQKLHAAGLEGRVEGTAKLFRVRVGQYATHADAAAAAKRLKARGFPGFVTPADGER